MSRYEHFETEMSLDTKCEMHMNTDIELGNIQQIWLEALPLPIIWLVCHGPVEQR